MTITWLIFETLGTIAFAFSGTVVGLSRRMDIFGITVLAVMTGVGGGMVRDVLCGITRIEGEGALHHVHVQYLGYGGSCGLHSDGSTDGILSVPRLVSFSSADHAGAYHRGRRRYAARYDGAAHACRAVHGCVRHRIHRRRPCPVLPASFHGAGAFRFLLDRFCLRDTSSLLCDPLPLAALSSA